MSTQEVLYEVLPGKVGAVGLITLNRPQALNALNLSMISSLYQQLKDWEGAANIKAVLIRAASGKAFCAGGDLRYVYENLSSTSPLKLFEIEYQLNSLIFNYPKPYIAFLDGITMGGGAGISIHGSHRIGTENLTFAMPETGIGFYPDVGGSYFLSRLPNSVGVYLALTGARISSEDCFEIGLISSIAKSKDFDSILQAILEKDIRSAPYQNITDILKNFSSEKPLKNFVSNNFIKLFAENTLEQIFLNLEDSYPEIYASLLKKSPLSLKVTKEALRRGQHLSFSQCMVQESILTKNFLKAHDFAEGIRAIIIDKDKSPLWQPSLLSQVSAELVRSYFS